MIRHLSSQPEQSVAARYDTRSVARSLAEMLVEFDVTAVVGWTPCCPGRPSAVPVPKAANNVVQAVCRGGKDEL